MTTLIELTDIIVEPTRLRVARLTLAAGMTVVLGDNGAGKSTLLDVVGGVLRPTQGAVSLLDGSGQTTAMSALSPQARAQRIASLGQRPLAAPGLTVEARIAQGLMPRRGALALGDGVRLRARSCAETLGIAPLLDRPLATLSGGELQRAHVGRALVDDAAEVVVLDEPFSSLDADASDLLAGALVARAARHHIVVVSVHDLDVAIALGGRALWIDGGAVVDDGPVRDVLERRGLRVVDDGEHVGVLRRRR